MFPQLQQKGFLHSLEMSLYGLTVTDLTFRRDVNKQQENVFVITTLLSCFSLLL